MKSCVQFSVLAIFCGCLLSAQVSRHRAAGEAKTEVLQADANYRQAVLNGDVRQLAAIFADDILIVHSDGGTDTKMNFLDAISSGRLKLTSYQRTDVQVRIYGSTALLFSKATKLFTYRGGPGKATDTSIEVFSKTGEQWRMVAMQNTPRSQ